MKFHLALVFLLLANITLHAQEYTIKPYLQNAEPHSITIKWETDSNEESIVEYGLSSDLGFISTGESSPSENGRIIHTVILENLNRFTTYYYRTNTANTYSDIYTFKTPPFESDDKDFRFIAMSDMQRASDHPNKFEEIVNDGIIPCLVQGDDLLISDSLAFVLIPGDLVTTGSNFTEWQQTFFNPAENLFSRVPVYPVLGNHEYNTPYYFQYFSLPGNGTPGYEEHWWYKDHANVRLIGLNSNSPFDSQEQLDWLDMTLNETCQMDSIDFVFAQLHHPHKSELWTPGESDFTGEVIARLEIFSENCGKPSAHLFGHTHGYSRGQSRDHKHLWINVATAGGAIDNWGEFPNYDYDEFSVSQDEYGFVSIDITNGLNPSMTIKRIGRGDQDIIENNVLRDSLKIYKNDEVIEAPFPLSPVNEEIAPECVTLVASDYVIPESGSLHGQSHWQISTIEQGLNNPIIESWKNFENWYFEEDTQAGDDLTDEKITGLAPNKQYIWRVRYRDRNMNWSSWSQTASFNTGESLALVNLIMNGGGEDGVESWVIDEGIVESLPSWECAGISSHSGEKYIIVGGLCEHSSFARCHQDIDVSMYADSIDLGTYDINFGGYFSNWGGSDLPEMQVFYLDSSMNPIDESTSLSTYSNFWTDLHIQESVPVNTRMIRVELRGTRNEGTDNDSYFDDLYLKLGKEIIDCDQTSQLSENHKLADVRIHPNPFSQAAVIELPDNFPEDIRIQISNAMGQKVPFSISMESGKILVHRENQEAGMYIFWLRDGIQPLAKGKFIIE